MKDYQTKQRKAMIQNFLMEDKIYSKADLVESGIKIFVFAFTMGVALTFILCSFIIK